MCKPCVWITQKTCLTAAGVARFCVEMTLQAPCWHGWSVLAGSNAPGWAKKNAIKRRGSHSSHVTLSDLAHASSTRRTARSVVHICLHRSTLVPSRAPVEFRERTCGEPQCFPQRPLQHFLQGNHLRKGVHADCLGS